MSTSPKVSRVAEFVLRQLKAHQLKWAKKEASAIPPLFVGVQGPQGSGELHSSTVSFTTFLSCLSLCFSKGNPS